MKIAVEYDDFSAVNHGLPYLETMKEHFPDFKVTLFTVPWEVRYCKNIQDSAPLTLEKFKPVVEAVNKADWIEIALHGLTHAPMEFAELSYEGAMKRLTVGMKMFQNAGVKNFVKIFKAPQWEISAEAKQAAIDMGFKVVEDGYYNWSLANDEPNADAKEPIIAHGHVQDVCDNGLEETMHRILKLPPDTEFIFLSDILKAKKGEYDFYGKN